MLLLDLTANINKCSDMSTAVRVMYISDNYFYNKKKNVSFYPM